MPHSESDREGIVLAVVLDGMGGATPVGWSRICAGMSARRATRMSEILYVLTEVSTIMLPLTFITGLFGMNVGIAGASYRGMSSTLVFLAVCAAITMIVWLGARFLVRRDLLMRAPPSKRP